MASKHAFPREEADQKPESPSRVRVNSQGSAYAFPSSSSPTRDNHHPYGVKTTSTGILTRSNSSAGTPFSHHSYSPLASPSAPNRTSRSRTGHGSHRYTKSLTSDGEIFTAPPPLPSPPPRVRNLSPTRSFVGEDDDMRHSTGFPSSDSDSLLSTRMRRSETLPSLFTPRPSTAGVVMDEFSEMAKELGLPQNPKYWSPTNLSLYIGTALSAKRGGPLPDHVLRDLQIYIIREKMTGRQFMRLSDLDLQDWGVNSLAKVQLIAQAQDLRQRAIKGRIYGFNERSTSPSKLSIPAHTAANSLESSPQSEETYQDSSENDEHLESAPDWMNRASFRKSTPRGSIAPSSRFSTPSRRSLGRLTNEESRGRVRGMVESFEHSSNSGRSRDGSVSSDASSMDEEHYHVDDRSDHLAPLENHFQVEDTSPAVEDENAEADTTITSPYSHPMDLTAETFSGNEISYGDATDSPNYAETDSGPHPDASVDDFNTAHDDLAWLEQPSDACGTAESRGEELAEATLHIGPTQEEPSIEDLLVDDDAEGIMSHPWEDEVVGQTARKVSAMRTSPRKSSYHSRKSGSFGSARPLTTPLGEIFAPAAKLEPSLEESVGTLVEHPTAPPSYSDQSVEADFADLDEVPVVAAAAPAIPPDVVELLEAFRTRLAQVEQKLDEMERREVQRELSDREEAQRRKEIEEATLAAQLAIISAPSVPVVAEPPEKVSVAVATDTPERRVVKKASSEKLKPRNVPKRPEPTSDYLPDGLPQFVIGASLGIVVIVVQTMLKRFSGKRT